VFFNAYTKLISCCVYHSVIVVYIMNFYSATDKEILNELGERLKQARINKNITIEDLSLQSGITSRTIQNIESGNPASTKNIIAILRALRLLEHLDNFIPEQKISPIMLAEMKGKIRKRASKKKMNVKKEDNGESEW